MFYVHFYTLFTIFGNLPIKKMPQCQFLFSAVFVFQKSSTGNILGIARDKNPGPYFFLTKPEPEGEPKGGQRAARQPQAWPALGPLLGCVWSPLAASDSAP